MQNTEVNQLLKKALFLETNQRTEFLNQIEEGELKEKLTLLLNDDTALTHFVIKTSHGAKPLAQQQIKDLKSGDKINQFIIVKLIAKGGMGSVYLAYDEKLKRNVAIKTIRSEYIKEKTTQQRFKQEAQILSQINHPSICQIYDYIDYEDGDMLVLELVDGITLNNIELSAKEKLDVFIQIASALEVAHKKDVIHRDLKPDNIMRASDNSIKVLDFGIAKSTLAKEIKIDEKEIKATMGKKPLTKMGSLMGTLLYMSPEQAEGKQVTKASDIYSLGIIMQEILTGVTTYDLVNTQGLRKLVITAQRVNHDLIPKKYQKLIAALTQKEPNERPSATEAVKSLKNIQDIPKRRIKKMAITALIILSVLGFSKYTYDLKQQTQAAQKARIAAESAQQKAEKSQQESEKVTEFLEGLFLVSDPFANAGEEMTARQMLDEGSKKIDKELAEQPSILFRLKATIGEIYIQLGEHDLAQQQFDVISPLLDSDLIDDEMKLDFLFKQASLYYEISNADKMESTLNKGLEIFKNNNKLNEYYYYDILFNLGVAFADKGKIEKALAAYQESMAFFLLDSKTYQYKIIENYNSQGLLYADRGNNEKAAEYLEKALAMVNPEKGKDLDYKTTIKGNLSYILSNLGQHKKAISYGLSIIELRKKLLGENHINLALSYDNMSTTYLKANNLEKCKEYNTKALNIYEKIVTKDNKNYVISLLNRARIFHLSGEQQKAETNYQEVLDLLHNIYGDKHKTIANLFQQLAHAQIDLEKFPKAQKNLIASIKMYADLSYPMQGRAVQSYKSLAIVYKKQGNHKKAFQTYKTLLKNLQSETEKDPKAIAEIQQLIQDMDKNP